MVFPPYRNLTTSRLFLRKITLSDRESYFRLFSSPEIARYMNWEPHTHIEQTDTALEKLMGRYETGKCYRWGITLSGSQDLIGIFELLDFNFQDSTCSFAYMVSPEHWNRGYGSEALMAAMDFAFGEMEMAVITACHMGPNLASGAAMKKAGMQFDRAIPGVFRKNGETFDRILYRITREEWVNRG